MAKTLQDYIDEMVKAQEAMGNMSSATKALEDKYLGFAKTMRDNIELFKQGKKTLQELTVANKAQQDQMDTRIKRMVEYTKETIAYQKEQEKLKNIIMQQTEVFKTHVKAYDMVNAAMHSVTGSVMGLVSAFGVQKVSWDGLVKTSLSYNKTLFELSRIQNVSGRGFKDIGATLEYVRTQTKMSQMEFLDLSNTMMKGFIGIKPSIDSVARMLKVWGDQMGYDYESSKSLFTSMQQFPVLFKAMQEGLAGIEKINNKKGAITEAEKRHNSVLKDQTLLYAMIGNVSTEEFDKISQALTPLTDQEKKYSELLKERAALAKSAGDLQLELAKQFQPIQEDILKATTKIVATMAEYKNATAGIAVAIAAMAALGNSVKVVQAGMAAFALVGAAAFAEVAAIIAGIVLAVGAIATVMFKWIDSENKAAEAARRLANANRLQTEMKADVISLNDVQLGQYRKLTEASKGENDTLEVQVQHHKEAMSEVTKQGATVAILYKQYQETLATVKQFEEAIDRSNSSLKNMVSTTEEFGGLAEKAYDAMLRMSKIDIANRMAAFRDAYKSVAGLLKSKGITLDLNVNADEARNALIEVSANIDKIKGSDKERIEIASAVSMALEQQNAITTKQATLVRGQVDQDTMRMRQQEKFSSAYEARLDSERKLMESAQFGLGASVAMMKQQVDLAYQLMETYAADDQHMQKRALSFKGMNESQLKAIQNSKTQAEAEKIIASTYKEGSKEYQYLTQYAFKHQEITKKIMDQQQKIYDLTKDIREGYLDAIREMAVGAGEFSKIIGTQEMGVTQLMKVVKGVTGKDALNTMKLGGMQSSESVAQGVGTSYAGRYTVGGARFEDENATKAKNSRYYKYGEYEDRAKKIIAGDVSGVRSKPGTGLVEGADKYLGEKRAGGEDLAGEVGDKSYDGTYHGSKDALNEWSKLDKSSRGFTHKVIGVNPGVTEKGGNVPGAENLGLVQGGRADKVNEFFAGIVKNSQAPSPVQNQYVPGAPGNTVPLPSELLKMNNILGKMLEVQFGMEEPARVIVKLLERRNTLDVEQKDIFKKLSTNYSEQYKKLEQIAVHTEKAAKESTSTTAATSTTATTPMSDTDKFLADMTKRREKIVAEFNEYYANKDKKAPVVAKHFPFKINPLADDLLRGQREQVAEKNAKEKADWMATKAKSNVLASQSKYSEEERGSFDKSGNRIFDRSAIDKQKKYEKAEALWKKSGRNDALVEKETGIKSFSELHGGVQARTAAVMKEREDERSFMASRKKEGRPQLEAAEAEKMVKDRLFTDRERAGSPQSYADKIRRFDHFSAAKLQAEMKAREEAEAKAKAESVASKDEISETTQTTTPLPFTPETENKEVTNAIKEAAEKEAKNREKAKADAANYIKSKEAWSKMSPEKQREEASKMPEESDTVKRASKVVEETQQWIKQREEAANKPKPRVVEKGLPFQVNPLAADILQQQTAAKRAKEKMDWQTYKAKSNVYVSQPRYDEEERGVYDESGKAVATRDTRAIARQKSYESAEKLKGKGLDDKAIQKQTGIADFSKIYEGVIKQGEVLAAKLKKEGRPLEESQKGVDEAETMVKGSLFKGGSRYAEKLKDLASTPEERQAKEAEAFEASELANFFKDGSKIQKDVVDAIKKGTEETKKVTTEVKRGAEIGKKSNEETKKTTEHEIRRGKTGGIIADPSAVAAHTVKEIDKMAAHGRETVATGREKLHSETGLGRTGKRIREIGESSGRIRELGAPSRHVREIGRASSHVKSTFNEHGDATYRENLKKQAKAEKDAIAQVKEAQKGTEQPKEVQKGAAVMETARQSMTGAQKDKRESSNADQAAFNAASAQKEMMFGSKGDESGGGGGAGGNATLTITLDKDVIGRLEGKINGILVALQGSSNRGGK